jgi:membrane-bound lytic murein transglycosylase A
MAKRSRAGWTALALVIVLLVAGAAAVLWWVPQPLQLTTGPLRLTKAGFGDLPGWQDNDPRAALLAFHRSCDAIARLAPDQSLGGAGYAGTARDWTEVCRAAPAQGSAVSVRRWFQDSFVPFAVSAGPSQDGLFTGYYEPQLTGSVTPHGAYRVPVYAMPDDLVQVDLGDFREALKGERIAGRVVDHRLVPYDTRAQIDAKGLDYAHVLFYSNDPVAVFFLHIQGSGRVTLDDGQTLRVAYAGQNGWPYTPIGRALIEQNAIPREHMSMQAIRSWMAAHPDAARKVMEEDKSYVFFKTSPVGDPSLGAAGAEGVPLTAGASLAVDNKVHALGVPVFIAATAPDPDPAQPEQAFDRLLVAQDMGGAIRGPVRGDVFWGFGAHAESIAGRMKSTGKLYVLLPKAVAARVSAPQT